MYVYMKFIGKNESIVKEIRGKRSGLHIPCLNERLMINGIKYWIYDMSKYYDYDNTEYVINIYLIEE